MDFSVTAEEEALVFRLAELLDADTRPREAELMDELGPDIAEQLDDLDGKGWVVVQHALTGDRMVVDLTSPAWQAVRNRRDAGR
ncbi:MULTISPECIES: hypothetical protein [Streptomycetaceae]|uniref:Uncharacterized protein n=1 Tax=Streptantibioticus cattleyicolor (strain ATCC 35852 / DSM 46488 / JCM 4925 / NBRC 14057 / NRRL 8057) TaxID=1003195 RepID=F8JW31_STREN|nr:MULTISPECIES: hypothetical protein [Streptomycetaceae]AEW93201.1 hypothetical protein SCATT_08300 [Streptantibioticus cattleyicolor NRRL 8057 = DSM 46488]MYS57925.1 hypothetical protein [Streptomyces sp. SID5468]CCB73562.1 protein of unknown function [Streptantibioticus cattleyicolor NRRL 8057 = DSM 46488]